MNIRLTPMKEEALRAMLRGELHYVAGVGWSSSVGIPGTWNSHTLQWLAGKGFCVIRGSLATITSDGRAVLDGAQGWAA